MEGSARFVVVLLLRHLAAAEFSENRIRLFADSVDPINTYAVVGVVVFRDLEHIGRSGVMKFHGQGIRREDVVGDVTAPLSSNVFIGGRVGDACCRYPTRKQRYKSHSLLVHKFLIHLLSLADDALIMNYGTGLFLDLLVMGLGADRRIERTMLSPATRLIIFATAFVASVTAANPNAKPEGKFDGRWSAALATKSGPCDAAYLVGASKQPFGMLRFELCAKTPAP